MSLTLLKQNAMILSEVAQNYENLLTKRKICKKEDISKIDLQISHLKKQILYLLALIDKLAKEEKNAR